MRRIYCLALFYSIASPFFVSKLKAQQVILLENPSFEDDSPNAGRPPAAWFYCGPPGETPPDIHPNEVFPQNLKAFEGQTYVGMVVRDNNTWEAIGQHLNTPLLANVCYSFSIYLAIPENFMSLSRSSQQPVNYNQSIRLRLWGAERHCEKLELVAESPGVKLHHWQKYTFIFEPLQSLQVLILEAFYDIDDMALPNNACIFIDDASPIVPIDCQRKKPLSVLPTATIPVFENSVELRQWVHAQMMDFKMGPSGFFAQQDLFQDAQGTLWRTNRPLWLIAQALKQFSRADVRLVLSSNSPLHFSSLTKAVEEAASKSNLPYGRMLVTKARKPEKQSDWLWSDPLNGLFVRLLEY